MGSRQPVCCDPIACWGIFSAGCAFSRHSTCAPCLAHASRWQTFMPQTQRKRGTGPRGKNLHRADYVYPCPQRKEQESVKQTLFNQGWLTWQETDAFSMVWNIPAGAKSVTLPHDAMLAACPCRKPKWRKHRISGWRCLCLLQTIPCSRGMAGENHSSPV